jgi:hypothetical protein
VDSKKVAEFFAMITVIALAVGIVAAVAALVYGLWRVML